MTISAVKRNPLASTKSARLRSTEHWANSKAEVMRSVNKIAV